MYQCSLLHTCTLSVKRNITFFRATLTKIYPIKINHICTQINFDTSEWEHLKKIKPCLCQKGEKAVKSQKISETAHQASSTEEAYSEHSITFYSISMAGYVIPVPAFVCGKLPRTRGEEFLWCLTTDLLRFHCIFLFFDSRNLFFLKLCWIRITIVNLWPNMNNFDAVDFSECRSEEGISLFRRSVYTGCPKKSGTADFQYLAS